jgi:hypothetical protein
MGVLWNEKMECNFAEYHYQRKKDLFCVQRLGKTGKATVPAENNLKAHISASIYF